MGIFIFFIDELGHRSASFCCIIWQFKFSCYIIWYM